MALKCDICQAEFRRTEHLNRHFLRHLGVRPFACPTCTASFARSIVRALNSVVMVPILAPDVNPGIALAFMQMTTAVTLILPRTFGHQYLRPGEFLMGSVHRVFLVRLQQPSVTKFCQSLRWKTRKKSHLRNQAQMPETISKLLSGTKTANAWLSWDEFLNNELATQENTTAAPMADEDGLRTQLISAHASHERREEARGCSVHAEVDGAVSETAVQEPTPTSLLSEDTPRAIFTNYSQLSSTFANAFRRSSVFSRDYDDSTEIEENQTRRKKHFVTHGLENLGRVAGSSFHPEGVDGNEEDWDLEAYDHVPSLSPQAYSILQTQFEKLNADTDYCKAFTDKSFPSREAIDVYIQSHFEHYHPIWPLLHQRTFDPERVHWILLLAVAATGCGFSKFGTLIDVFLLQEFLRRSINLCLDLDPEPDAASELCLTQAVLLSQIGLMFSGSMSFAEHAQRNMSLLATLCRRAGYFSGSQSLSEDIASLPANWKRWICAESKRRLLLDGQLGLFFDLPPTIPTDLLLLPLPSDEGLWASDSAEIWADQASRSPNLANDSLLREQLVHFWRDEKVKEGLSSLNRLFLTFAVYRDSANNQDAIHYLEILRGDEDIKPPTGKIQRITLQHNHAFSLLLHMPLRVLTAFSGWGVSPQVREAADGRLSLWLRQNKGKARVIIYHAAKLFSYIRNHPTCGHHENNALLYATLSMWIHTLFNRHQTSSLRTHRLDKPNHQEALVQWLSGDSDFRLYVAGIGDLNDERASDRLVQESVRILTRKSGWSLGLAVSMVMRAQWRSNRGIR
ncbi:uncharacterized protein CCOS01_12109 [Colletotrichum costaricense]|uniref:C2H2-type domain-containing protein n=1 Tax=Colletotrichum costaricense TaxID=1209916 RepID=A0AAJ0DWC7_9PEZI|nr:uncharacterized protein CCOS01_12109 [Colletotrichum costaricense]KAK1517852.1 hypothetical protein CCOS01_12109 [Colletotrichum costaricense]